MSKIREESEMLIGSEVDPGGLTVREGFPLIKKQARRVLLLDKAYRYQRAAMKLLLCSVALALDGRDIGTTSDNAQAYHDKAADLYRQAEEL